MYCILKGRIDKKSYVKSLYDPSVVVVIEVLKELKNLT